MDLVRYWRIVVAYRLMILITAISGFAVALGTTYVLPEKYQGTAVVLVRPREKLRLAPSKAAKEVLDFPVSQLAPIDAPSKTYIEVIKSRFVVEGIVRALALDKKTRQPAENYYRELWERFKEDVRDYADWTVKILKYGRVPAVDPFTKAVERAQKNLSLKSVKDTYTFEISYLASDPQVAAAVANKAAAIFIDYMSGANRNESRESRNSLATQRRDAEQELTQARAALRTFKEQQGVFSLTDEYSSRLKVLGDVRGELERSEAKLAALMNTYTSSHPKVVSAVAERDRLLRSLSELGNGTEAYAAKEKALDDLRMRVKMAEENYEVIGRAYEDARIRETDDSSEIRIVSAAVAPTYPVKPIKYYYAGGGLAMALIVGIGLALLLEFENSRVRSVADVTGTLGLPVLATIPVMKIPRDA